MYKEGEDEYEKDGFILDDVDEDEQDAEEEDTADSNVDRQKKKKRKKRERVPSASPTPSSFATINSTFFVPKSHLTISLLFSLKSLDPVANQLKLRDGDLPIHIRICQRGTPRQTLRSSFRRHSRCLPRTRSRKQSRM
ncbi:hypothetical protein L1887_00904 [Cichorium endivia]|nr:hypothetical protein L1887_00904 [Cichorium endivia]